MRRAAKTVVLTLLFLTLAAMTAFLIYLHFFASNDRDLSGEWTTELDMTEQAAVTALIWLQDIEAVSISLEDMESCMQNLTVQVNLVLEQSSRTEGSFHSAILPESYEACNQAASEAFSAAFRALLADRLHMAGYDSTDEEAIEALVNEAFGMSTVSYLQTCGPALLPSLEELQAQFDGSGRYEATDDILTRWFEEGAAAARAEHYIRKDGSLILSGEDEAGASDPVTDYYPMVYMLSDMEERVSQ